MNFAKALPWWPLLATAVLGGCGGSSSETPPPLAPDPLHAPYRPESAAVLGAENRKDERNAEPSNGGSGTGAPPAREAEKPGTNAE
jgi:hypothetical protein